MQNHDDNSANNADIFSHGSLRLTYSLLRQRNPPLALVVRNILGQPPLQKTDAASQGLFRIELESLQVREVVESLVAVIRESNSTEVNPGQLVLAKSLLEEWMALAQKMLEAHNRPAPNIH